MVHNICEECGKEFISRGTQRFCSRSCSASHNNRGRVRSLQSREKTSKSIRIHYHGEINEYEVHEEQICENCGKPINDPFTKRRFCSIKCQGEYNRKNKIQEWLCNPSKYNSPNIYPFIRRYLMELHDNKCEICGWSETNIYNGNIPLEVHHIDGDSTNNKPENLQLLCPNCHSLTNTFGRLNEGKSKRYKKS